MAKPTTLTQTEIDTATKLAERMEHWAATWPNWRWIALLLAAGFCILGAVQFHGGSSSNLIIGGYFNVGLGTYIIGFTVANWQRHKEQALYAKLLRGYVETLTTEESHNKNLKAPDKPAP